MVDRLTSRHRSWNMSRIRSKDTGPELAVRSALHRLGYRFRLHKADLPGRPDIVLPRHRIVILVHGCFWHRHRNCQYSYTPRSRVSFWEQKFRDTVARDRSTRRQLHKAGWSILTIWECQARPDTLTGFLSSSLARLKRPRVAGRRRARESPRN